MGEAKLKKCGARRTMLRNSNVLTEVAREN